MPALASPLAAPLGGDVPVPITTFGTSTAGTDIALTRNPATGRFDFAFTASSGGDVAFDDTNEHRVLSLLLEHRDRWFAAKKGRGSRLYAIKHDRASTTSLLESSARDALKKATDEGWISDVSARAVKVRAGRFSLFVQWKNPSAKPGTLTVSI
jgi:phage gp46-like protein